MLEASKSQSSRHVCVRESMPVARFFLSTRPSVSGLARSFARKVLVMSGSSRALFTHASLALLSLATAALAVAQADGNAELEAKKPGAPDAKPQQTLDKGAE